MMLSGGKAVEPSEAAVTASRNRIDWVGIWLSLSRHIRSTVKSQVARLASAVLFRLTWSPGELTASGMKSTGDLMSLGECCLLFSHHCPDVLFYSIQVDFEYYERKENANVTASLAKGEPSHRIDHDWYLELLNWHQYISIVKKDRLNIYLTHLALCERDHMTFFFFVISIYIPQQAN